MRASRSAARPRSKARSYASCSVRFAASWRVPFRSAVNCSRAATRSLFRSPRRWRCCTSAASSSLCACLEAFSSMASFAWSAWSLPCNSWDTTSCRRAAAAATASLCRRSALSLRAALRAASRSARSRCEVASSACFCAKLWSRSEMMCVAFSLPCSKMCSRFRSAASAKVLCRARFTSKRRSLRCSTLADRRESAKRRCNPWPQRTASERRCCKRRSSCRSADNLLWM
mmetsp:Transcript_68611/g.146885  ORF Transcript_68611/g.146885 Transcript_68611/m.146885 type:complete len:229 (-) Transcript_68611:582-1268(-)